MVDSTSPQGVVYSFSVLKFSLTLGGICNSSLLSLTDLQLAEKVKSSSLGISQTLNKRSYPNDDKHTFYL